MRGFRVYDTTKKRYVTNELCWVVTNDGQLHSLEDGDLIGYPSCIKEDDTGLTDKNGKKIFEGDIVRLREQKNKKLVIGEIKYKGHGFYLIKNNNGHIFTNGLYGVSEVEIIGNTHDNPELLEENK